MTAIAFTDKLRLNLKNGGSNDFTSKIIFHFFFQYSYNYFVLVAVITLAVF